MSTALVLSVLLSPDALAQACEGFCGVLGPGVQLDPSVPVPPTKGVLVAEENATDVRADPLRCIVIPPGVDDIDGSGSIEFSVDVEMVTVSKAAMASARERVRHQAKAKSIPLLFSVEVERPCLTLRRSWQDP